MASDTVTSSVTSPNYQLATNITSPSNASSICGTDSHDSGGDAFSNHFTSSSGIDVSSSGASSNGDSSDHPRPTTISTKCPSCSQTFTFPKVLDCFHTFCQSCLEKQPSLNQTIACPECHQATTVPVGGLSALPCDSAINAVLESKVIDQAMVSCTGCKSKETSAKGKCFDCANYLCQNCMSAHQYMYCFKDHRVEPLKSLSTSSGEKGKEKAVFCEVHKAETVDKYCRDCDQYICALCEPAHELHNYELLKDCCAPLIEEIRQCIGAGKVKASQICSYKKVLELTTTKLGDQRQAATVSIQKAHDELVTLVGRRREEMLKELDTIYTNKQTTLEGQISSMQVMVDKMYSCIEFSDKLFKFTPPTEVLAFKKLITSRIQECLAFQPDDSNLLSSERSDLEFVSNYQAMKVSVNNTFGYIRQTNCEARPQPIARPSSSAAPTNKAVSSVASNLDHFGRFGGSNTSLNSMNGLNGFSFVSSSSDINAVANQNAYEAWSNAFDSGSAIPAVSESELFPLPSIPLAQPAGHMTDMSRLLNTNIYPPKSQIKRQKMIYRCKFGEFGILEGQFSEPSGVAVNAQGDIIVADTNNHRIQIFDSEGRFKFQFGECGKRDGQLLYPNRVAVVKQTGDIVVTERSPTHQVQIFNQYGQFVRKFGANVLQHPRGVTVDNMGRIVIVECKVMRVVIFDLFGNILQKFNCSKHLEFPNGVVVNDEEEIFISDNRAHCVKVFNYQGQFTRQIGGEGVSNYPIGVGINSSGEILIADNHNNFNLTIFSQDGQIQQALESKVKHAQCFDVALLDENSIVLASKDYRLYIYKYASGSYTPSSAFESFATDFYR